jgi:2-(1,2-epoxy-1,2-dihydrophenyl)acetyl-CoA isomerase
MESTATIKLDIDNGVAIVSLVNPTRGNPIDGEFGRELKRIAAQLHGNTSVRSVLLRAEGQNFSFGGDLKVFHAAGEDLPSLVLAWTADLHAALQRFWRLPVPIVAAVQGFVMGGALSLVAGCDVVIGGSSVKMGSAFSKIGFSCDSGSSVTLSARMGAARARRFVLLAETLHSDDALQAGLVDQIVPDEQLHDTALALATQLANGPTIAYGQIKRLFARATATGIEDQLEEEALTLARICVSQDAQEGIAAQVQRRKAEFRGR